MPKICFLPTLKIDLPTSLRNMDFKLLENIKASLKVIRGHVLETRASNNKHFCVIIEQLCASKCLIKVSVIN